VFICTPSNVRSEYKRSTQMKLSKVTMIEFWCFCTIQTPLSKTFSARLIDLIISLIARKSLSPNSAWSFPRISQFFIPNFKYVERVQFVDRLRAIETSTQGKCYFLSTYWLNSTKFAYREVNWIWIQWIQSFLRHSVSHNQISVSYGIRDTLINLSHLKN